MSRLGFGFGFNKPDYFLTLPFRYGAVAYWDFTDSSKLIEGATSTDVEGWKDSTVTNVRVSGDLGASGTFEKTTDAILEIPITGPLVANTYYEVEFVYSNNSSLPGISIGDSDSDTKLKANVVSESFRAVIKTNNSPNDFLRVSGPASRCTINDVEVYELDPASVSYDLAQPTASAQLTFTQPNGPVVFDGFGQFLEDLPPQSGDFTYIVKFKKDIDSVNMLLGNSSNTIEIFAYINSNTIRVRTDQNISHNISTSMPLGQFSTLSLTRFGDTFKLFNNGIFVDQFTDTGSISLDWLGARTDMSIPFEGEMEAIQIYNQPLTDQQIAAITVELNS